MPLAGIAAASIGGSLVGGLFGKSAADTQAQAAQQAAALEAQDQQKALQFQQQVFDTQQAEQQPWMNAGKGALTSLQGLLAPGGQLTQQFGQFQAPTLAEAEQNPGYQFALQQGEQALQAGAAAQGNLLSAGTQKGLVNYGQQAGQQDYQQVYNNALNAYQQNFNTFNTNQQNMFNRYASLAGLGQQAASTAGAQAGQAANNYGNLLLTGAQQIGLDKQAAAYQTGSGYAALGNALSNGLGNLAGLLSLKSILSPQASGSGGNIAAPSLQGLTTGDTLAGT